MKSNLYTGRHLSRFFLLFVLLSKINHITKKDDFFIANKE